MFFNKLGSKINQGIDNKLERLNNEISQVQINQGKYLGQLNLLHNQEAILNDIKKAEFKVFSQWGDDGIINFLINYLNITNKTFIEFGVENYLESNTRFLLLNDNWSGLIIDGSKDNIKYVRNSSLYWKYDLIALDAFITAANINDLISSAGFHNEVGILSIDIDGNDYWVWKAITIKPIILIIEYNSVFGPLKKWTVPYDSEFIRSNKHFSNLYFGASVAAIADLSKEKGYSFIGCNSAGNNAYFIRNDKLNSGFRKVEIHEGFVESKFKESRDENGKLTYLRNGERLEKLKGMEVFNTELNKVESI